MKVSDLIEILQEHDADAEVMIAYNYGDYSRTNCVADIVEVEVQYVYETAYSPSGLAVADRDRREEDAKVADTRVVINAMHVY